ncbi:MAG: Tol biopolymer transport system component, partial [Saprospiraceae bacterium]
KGIKNKLVEHGRLTDAPFGSLSTDGRKIYWAELAFNARWSNREWSVIYEYDIFTNSKKKITKKSRLFAPDVNSEGTHIVAVRITEEQKHQLIILDLEEPSKQVIVENIGDYALSQPKWIDENNIVAVLSKNEKSHLASVDIRTGVQVILTPLLSFQLSHPMHSGGKVYFSAAYERINNIYAVNLDGGNLQKITHSKIGAFQPCVTNNGKHMAFTEFSSEGYKIKTSNLNPSEFQNFEPISGIGEEKAKGLSHESILDEIPSNNYKIKNYSHLSGLLNPHSLLADIDDQSAELTLRSDNKFNTMSIEAGARYDFNEDRWGYGIQMNYAEFYPILHAGITRRYRAAESLNFGGLSDTSIVFSNYISEWSENSVNVGLTIPYNFSKGNMNNNFQLRTDYIHTSLDLSNDINDPQVFRDTIVREGAFELFENIFDEPLRNGSFSTIDTRFLFQMLKNRASQHLAPRMGIALFGRFRNNLDEENFGGDVWSYGGSIFLPGLGKNHSLNIQAFFQNESVISPYRYGDASSYPRGYNVSFRRDDFGKIGLNYSFPIAYPDMALGGLAFIKRIKGKAFYDHGWLKYTSFPGEETKQDQRSLGFELGVDFRALRLVEVDLGFRYSYLLDSSLLGSSRSPHQFDFFVLSIREQ